jgi:hypothetical protein
MVPIIYNLLSEPLLKLCKLLNEGINEVRNNRVLSAEDVFREVESAISE